jgi:hypothetical protein
VGLPPDLARLGNDLVEAARRTTTARRARRRRRVAVAVLGAALAFAALIPAAVDPAHRELSFAATGALTSASCDLSRGARTSLVRCEGPMVLYRPYAIN